jgi:hypothetical protein
MQKRAARGDIMTIAMVEPSFPNYTGINLFSGMATNTSQDENGIYVSAYTPQNHTFAKNATSNAALAISTSALYGEPCWYYTAAKEDTDESPVYVFYTLIIIDDWMFLRVRGNPATLNNTISHFFVGTNEYPKNLASVNNITGCWGMLVSPYTVRNSTWDMAHWYFTGYADSGSSWQQFTRIVPITDYWNYGLDMSLYDWGALSYEYSKKVELDPTHTAVPMGYPLGSDLNSGQFIMIPPKFMMMTRGNAMTDELSMIAVDDSKRLYIQNDTTNGSSLEYYGRPWLIWALDHPTNFAVKDTGSGYQLTWDNPDLSALMQVKVMARTDAYPVDAIDPLATEVYSNTSPVAGDTVIFVDGDGARYAANDIYYTVFAKFDATPEAQWSLPSTNCKAFLSKTVESFSSIRQPLFVPDSVRTSGTIVYSGYTAAVPKMQYFESTNERKLCSYVLPHRSYQLNDSAANNIVVDRMGTANAALIGANTEAVSVPTRNGRTGFRFSDSSKNVKADNMNGVYGGQPEPRSINHANTGVSLWWKFNTEPSASIPYYFPIVTLGTPGSETAYWFPPMMGFLNANWLYSTQYPVIPSLHFSSGGIQNPSGNGAAFNPNITPDTNWHHYAITYDGVLRGYFDGDCLFYLDPAHLVGSTYAQYWPYLGGSYPGSWGNASWYLNALLNYVGTPSLDSTAEQWEIFKSAPSGAQIKHIYNNGDGLINGAVFAADTPNAYRMMVDANAAGERLMYYMLVPYNAKGKNKITFDAMSTLTGAVMSVGIARSRDTSPMLITPTMNEANTWESKVIDISGLSDSDKSEIKFLVFEVVSPERFAFAIKNVGASVA